MLSAKMRGPKPCTSRIHRLAANYKASHSQVQNMSQHQITAIHKPDCQSSHEHITKVRCGTVVFSVEDVIYLIDHHLSRFYVSVGGATAWVEVVHPGLISGRRPYIRTTPDWTGKDNLLNLPEF